jgi:SPP1 gp7 family putative phage head morphogenesis protein
MEEVLVHKAIKNYDPTRTTALRNAFVREMKRRFTELVKVIRLGVETNDCFALNEKGKVTTFQMTPIPKNAFQFVRSAEKVQAFMKWLDKQVEAGLLQIGIANQLGNAVENAWMNMYVLDSYKRGVIRARSELQKIGAVIPSIENSGGINMIMNNPFHIDRVGLMYTRVFSELKGITSAMDAIISKILSQGLIDGDGPALLAKKLVAAINGTGIGELGLTDKLGRFIPAMQRAELLARTEIIRAHHLATIQEYRNWGLEGVTVKGEWNTAGDDRVCDRCSALEGKIFTLDEIEGMIPLHPLCRCIALPYIEELQKYFVK